MTSLTFVFVVVVDLKGALLKVRHDRNGFSFWRGKRNDAQSTPSNPDPCPHHLIVSSVVSCPIAKVLAPPAVIVIAPSEAIVPAKSPAVPEAVETMLEKFAAAFQLLLLMLERHQLGCSSD